MLRNFLLCLPVLALSLFFQNFAFSLSLDWKGHFRGDHNFVHNYQMDINAPGNSRSGNVNAGELVSGEGKKSTTYSSMFLRLKPNVLVNDNVILRSEWNVGDPVAGFFGRGIPRTDRNDPTSTRKDALELSVSRLWMDAHTEFGTLQVGRAPMHWGLGVIFNSGDGPFDRFQSTSDTIRVHSKFGNLTLMPLYAKNSMGKNLAGASDPLDTNPKTSTKSGSDDVTDYGLTLKYENVEDGLEVGGMYYKRNASDSQNSYYFPGGSATYRSGANGINLKLFDFYARKTWGVFTLGAEVPIFQGEIGDVNGVGSRNEYSATAAALEASLKFDTWWHELRLGTVPGQGPRTTGKRGKEFSAMNFHRAYKLGHILFNYNLSGFGAANPDAVPGSTTGNAPADVVSPYDAAIGNAKYLMLSTDKRWEQWSLGFDFIYALANESASAGKDAYHHRTRTWFTSVASQSNKLGWEADMNTSFRWDENVSFAATLAMFFPGDFYKYANDRNFSVRTSRVTAFSLSTFALF